MKKILIITLLFLGIGVQAQVFGTMGFDIANAVIGSKPTDRQPQANLQFKVGARINMFEGAVVYESFEAINFQQYSVNLNVVKELYTNLDLALGVEGGSIIRKDRESFYFIGTNLELRYAIWENLNLGIQFNLRQRNDIEELYKTNKSEYRLSNFLNLTYTFKKKVEEDCQILEN